VKSKEWDLTGYLVSLGLSRNEAVAWARAREEDRPFKADWSDGVGHHLDKIWSRLDARPSMTTGRVPITNETRSSLDRLTPRRLVAILWAYSFAIWIYVVANQFANWRSLYWPVAWWLPIRLDYFGELGFVFSFVFAVLWVKLGEVPG
jgi:hypothetical protein